MIHATNHTTAAANTAAATPTLPDLLAAMRSIADRFPPDQMVVRCIVGAAVWADLRERAPLAREIQPQFPSPLAGLKIELDSSKHPQWCEREFLDGHREVWTPVGWVETCPAGVVGPQRAMPASVAQVEAQTKQVGRTIEGTT